MAGHGDLLAVYRGERQGGQTRHHITDGPTRNRTERKLTQPEGDQFPSLQSNSGLTRAEQGGGESKACCQTPKNVADRALMNPDKRSRVPRQM
jgi:hypothetical protein